MSHEPEDTTASDDVSHVIVYHDDVSQDAVSRDSRLEPGSTDSSESESEVGDDGDNKLYSECLGVDWQIDRDDELHSECLGADLTQ